MEKISHSDWPEIVFGTSDSAESQAIRRAIKANKLRKLAPRIYTSNLIDREEDIISRNCYLILSKLFPGAVLSHRTALEGALPKEGIVVLTYKYNKKLKLPGLTIRLIAGKGPQPGDTPFMDNLFFASRARALLENLQVSRTKGELVKTVSRQFIENHLEKICQIYGVEELNLLRDQARHLAELLDMRKEFKILDKIISALLGSHPVGILKTDIAHARAKKLSYDNWRVELLGNLASTLKKEIIPLRKENISTGQQLLNCAFFEAYFSNYIEGTEFEIEEASDIVFHNKKIPQRPEDAHDILATFRIVSNTAEMDKVPNSSEDLIYLLQKRHEVLMSVRKDKQPGKFKMVANRAGNTTFVTPELVKDTLLKSFALYENLDPGISRALFIMFVVAEIHPFLDGNGRLARIMMNAELVHARQCRIIIPTVYREDYLLALRQLTLGGNPSVYIRMLLRAQAFTANIDFSDYSSALQELKKCNAFLKYYEGKLVF